MRRLMARRLGVVPGALLLCALLTAADCRDSERPPATQTPTPLPRPAFRLVLVTDVDGYLEPCGCQSRPLGGIDKAAAQLRALASDGVPALLIGAGDVFAAPESQSGPALAGSAVEAATQAQAQAETLATIFGRLSLAAAAPGPADLRLGPAALRDLAQRGGFAWLCSEPAAAGAAAPSGANTQAPQAGEAALCRRAWSSRAAACNRRLGLGRDHGRSAGAREAAYGGAASARRSGGRRPVERRRAQRAARGRREPGARFAAVGGTDSAEVPPPERIGRATLLRAARDGHGLLVADSCARTTSAFIDVSAWTRKADKETLEGSVADLTARVEPWRNDKTVDRAEIEEQEARLGDMREQLAALDARARRRQPFSARSSSSARRRRRIPRRAHSWTRTTSA